MIISELFPTPVAHFHLDDLLNDKHKAFIYSQEQSQNEGNTTSLCRNVLDQELFSDVKKTFLGCLDECLTKIGGVKNGSSLRITQSWLNYSKKNQWHHKHSHQNSFLSGVFYVNADPEKDRIYFYKDGYQQIRFLIAEWNKFNSDSWWLPVKSGQLIIFPSHFTHSVAPVETEDARVSLSFNTFPVGNIGNNESLTGLDL